MTKRTKIFLFSIVAVVVAIGAVLMLPKAAPVAQATIPVNFNIPIEFENDWENFRFLYDAEIYADEECTQLLSTATTEENLSNRNAEISFNRIPNADVLYVKLPPYKTSEAVSPYSVELSDTEDVYLEIDGEQCFKLSSITINQDLPSNVVSSGGAVGIIFEAVGKQYTHPGISTMVIDGVTYKGGLTANYTKDPDLAGTIYEKDTQLCSSFSCIFMIPNDIEIDVNELEIVFDTEYELHPSTVVPYYPDAVTE